MENMAENTKKIRKIQKNCEIIWKIWKKIVKRFATYGRKIN
jgi:hypothetical protein